VRGAEHITAHCPGTAGRHELVVLTCGQCLDDVVEQSIVTKDKLIKLGGELKDAITKDRWRLPKEVEQAVMPLEVRVLCDGCNAILDAQVGQVMNKLTVKVVPHVCGRPPDVRKSAVFTKGSYPEGGM